MTNGGMVRVLNALVNKAPPHEAGPVLVNTP